MVCTGGIVEERNVSAGRGVPGRGKKAAVGGGVLAVVSLLAVGVVLGTQGAGAHHASARGGGPAAGSTAAATPTGAPQASAAGPAQRLADLDGGGRPVAAYQQVLDALAPRCTQDLPHLAAVVDSTLRSLRKHGVDDEDRFGVLQQWEHAVPAGKPRADCAPEVHAWAARRAGS
ncbi:hypothetical protein [Streptomyces tropicalis]|uniref:Uncharacterized protein n=1 Tax=Streptomyces tropicalis TaxID=3034234 RepID=A0ABT6ABA7_9ACTN|nr:hypothetical protein [Streptomyces tropicalis]MDF3301611.1 hypothetical protein [Streptomyces tropicalis]